MNWKYVGLTLFGFAAPSAVIGVAYAIGTNGTVLGSIACIVLTAASVLGSLMLLASIQMCGARIKMFGDVAQAAFGARGAACGNLLQQANFFLFLPVALRLCADSAQGVVDPEFKICTNYFVFGIAALCYIITQLRSLDNSKKFTVMSLVCAIVIAILQIVIVFTHSNDDKEDVLAFGNPAGDTGLGVFKGFLGVTVSAWAYVPSFLVVELWNEIPNATEMRKGIILSGVLNVIFFLGVGLPVAVAWGWDLENPITELDAWPSDTAMSRAMNFLVLAANFVSYALSSIPFVRYCQLSFFPHFEVQKWSSSTVVQYALISLPSFLIAVVLAIVIPNLFVMLALMTAITVPTVTQIYPAVCFLALLNNQPIEQSGHMTHTQAEMERYRGLLVDERRSDKRLGHQSHNDSLLSILEGSKTTPEEEAFARFDKPGYKRMAYVVLVIGVVNLICCWLAAFGKLAYDELRGESSIGCGSWRIL